MIMMLLLLHVKLTCLVNVDYFHEYHETLLQKQMFIKPIDIEIMSWGGNT